MKYLLAITTFICLFLPTQAFSPASPFHTHLLYHFFHANIFHLAANILCLFLIKFPIRYLKAFLVATFVSFLPCPTWQWSQMSFEYIPVCGLSAFLLAVIGIAWGEVSTFNRMVKTTLLPVAVFSLLPNVNLLIHVYALIFGFVVGKLKFTKTQNFLTKTYNYSKLWLYLHKIT